MGVKNWLKASILLPGLCLAALPVLAQHQQDNPPKQQETDPVADAARKARDQQKAAPKPKRVYTDDDIKPAASSNEGAAAGSAAGGSQGTAAKKQGAANGEDKSKGSGESAETKWRKRFADQRDKIATAEKELDVLQRESDKSQTQYYSDPQKALMEQNTRKDINERDAKINAKKQEIASLKQQLADLEDALRKSGGDSGWAR
jgi:hypothetical protein